MSFICLIWRWDGWVGLALLVWQTRSATTTPRIHRLFFFFFPLSAHTCHHVTSPDPTYLQHYPTQALPHTWHPNNGHDDLPEQTRVQATTLRARQPQQRPLPAIFYLTRSKPRLVKSRTSRTQWLLHSWNIKEFAPRVRHIRCWSIDHHRRGVESGPMKTVASYEQHPNEQIVRL